MPTGRHATARSSYMTSGKASLPTPTTGWLLAGAILAAARLGRKQAEDERIAQLQGLSESALEADLQALLRQQAQDRGRSQRAAELASKRLNEARQRAAELEKGRQAEDQKLLEAAARQRELADQARAVERAAYEAREAELRAELEQRADAERQARAERLAAQRAVEDRLRREAEERRREQALLRQRQEEERLEQQRLERERKAAEQREIWRLSTQFSVTLEGSTTMSVPPEGMETQGRLPKPAILQLEVVAGSLLGGSATYGPIAFESVDVAREQLLFQLCTATHRGALAFAASARLRRLTDEGPLTRMSESELEYWMRCAAIRAAAEAAPGAALQLEQFGNKRARLSSNFQARSRRGVLPEDDPRRTEAVLRRAITSVEADDLSDAGVILRNFVEDEEKLLSQDLSGGNIPEHTAAVLASAFFLDLMWADRPSKRVEASPWFEAASGLACSLLTERAKSSPQDSLRDVASTARALLPRDNVIARHVERLAEANRSPQTRAKLKEREELLQAELAERLVEFEWPDRAALAASRQARIEATTPLPERIWALKNVGATLAIGSPEGRDRARKLLERAVNLKRELVGSRKHPGMLPELDALAKVLELDAEWARDASAIRAIMMASLSSIAEAYVSAGDVPSAVILLEASVREYEETLGLRQAEVVEATKRANSLFETLDEGGKAEVVAARRKGDIVSGVLRRFEEDVASRKVPGALHKFESWDEGGSAWLGRLV